MPTYSGIVTLPDGRQFRGTSVYSEREADTGAMNFISIDIEDLDGNPLDADTYNQEVLWPGMGGPLYLWEAVDELLGVFKPEPEDD